MKQVVEDEFEKNVSSAQQVMQEMQDALRRVQVVARLFDLKVMAQQMELDTRFDKDQVDRALRILFEFQKEIRRGELQEAGVSLEQIASALFGAGRWADIKRISIAFPNLTRRYSKLRSIMLLAWNQIVFRDAVSNEDLDQLKSYFAASWDDGCGENALPLQLVQVYRGDSSSAGGREARNLLGGTRGFDSVELMSFLHSFGCLTDAKLLARVPEAVHFAMADAAACVVRDCRDKWIELLAEHDDNIAADPRLNIVAHNNPPHGIEALRRALFPDVPDDTPDTDGH